MKKENNLDKNLYIAVAKVLRNIRNKKGYSLEELANKMDKVITRQTLSRYECALMRMPVQSFISICKGLGEEPKDVWKMIMKEYSNIENSNSTF